MKNNDYAFDTLQVHGGQSVDKDTMSRSVPIYQTTSYLFKDTSHAKRLFDLEEEGNIYTRMMNPTTDVFEKRMALLEKGKGALAVASGTSAILYSILNIAKSGDEIISSSKLYGGTYNLFSNTFKRFGIKTKFFDPDDPEQIRELVTDKTKAIYYETIGNPSINIPDFEKITKIANEKGIVTIVDNTFATPYLFRPIEHGAQIVVHSATKYIGGHGNSIGGVVIDSGNFNFKDSKRYSEMNKPDEGYHGIVYTDKFKELAYIVKMRTTLLRDTGACISPFNSFLLLLGLETLSLRMEKHIKNASEIVKCLSSNPYVSWINYPGLESDKYHLLSKKYLPKGAGGIFTFGIKGGYNNAVEFIENLKLFSHLANVADAKSLVIHPSSTTHAQLTKEKQKMAGITSDMIRVSVGIEDAKDLIDDIENSLKEVMRK